MLSIILAGAMIASTSTALAATTKPTPKPTVKATAKVAPKVTAKTTAKAKTKATAKTTPKPSTKSTSKATSKATKKTATKKPVAKKTATKKSVTKKPVVKKTTVKKRTVYKRKVVKVSPSPSPNWPPSKASGWNYNGEIYYKIPTGKELLGELSAAAALSEQVKSCAKYACGVVKIASTNGCTWWSIDSVVYGPLSATDSTPVPYGNLRTTAKGTNPKQATTVIMMSTEPLKLNMNVGQLGISCYHTPVTSATEKIPSNVYTLSTPTPSDSATPTTNTN